MTLTDVNHVICQVHLSTLVLFSFFLWHFQPVSNVLHINNSPPFSSYQSGPDATVESSQAAIAKALLQYIPGDLFMSSKCFSCHLQRAQ